MTKRFATIKDVAEIAGVSASTVSNVLNGRDDQMQAGTRERVRAALDASGYRPSRAARQLRAGRNPAIGLVVPSVANPFWGSWAAHLESAALARGRDVVLCNSERDPARERAHVERLGADGVEHVVLSTSLPSLDHLGAAMERGMRVIVFDREEEPDDPPGLLRVSVDNALGADVATEHLIERGHRRIGFVSGAISTVSRRRRLAGYRRALTRHGIPFDERLVWDSPELGDAGSGVLGRESVRALLRLPDPPSAFVAINDMFAIGASAAVREAGAAAHGLAVVGFDDIELAALVSPTLTTVRQPLDRLAEAVVGLIVDGAAAGLGSMVVAPQLVVRESTALPRATAWEAAS